MFTARYGLIPYIKQITFRLLKVNETWISSTYFRKILKYQVSCKSVQRETNCSMRTDMTKLIVDFRNFANAPKHGYVLTMTWSQQSHPKKCASDSTNKYLILYDCLSPHSLLYKVHWALPGSTAAGAWCWPSSAELRTGSSCTFASSLCVHRHVMEWPLPLPLRIWFYIFQRCRANNWLICNTISFATFKLASLTINPHIQLINNKASNLYKPEDNVYGKMYTPYIKYNFKIAFLETLHEPNSIFAGGQYLQRS